VTTAPDQDRAVQRLARRRPRAVSNPTSRWTREDAEERAGQLIDGLDLLEDRELARRDADLLEAVDIVAREVNRGQDLAAPLPDLPSAQFKSALARAELHDNRAQRFQRVRDEAVATVLVKVRSEPRTYRPDGEPIHLRDLALRCLPAHPEHEAAERRLERHSREVGREAFMASPEGRRACGVSDTIARGRSRLEVEAERRALTTGSGSAGAFVTPQYAVDAYATYLQYPASFFDQCATVPDSGYGLEFLIPAFSSAATTGQQDAENTGVDDSSPAAGYLTGNLLTFAGEIDVSQQLIDRAGPVSFDVVAHAVMQDSLRQQIDSYLISQAISAGQSVSGASSFTVADFWADLGKAKAAMRTAAGFHRPPTHIFMTDEWHEYGLSQSDPNGRPLFLPTSAGAYVPMVPGPNGSAPAGWTGDRVLSTGVWTDGNIPASSSDAQFIIANMGEVFVLATEPTLRVIPETLAADLSCVVQLVSYVGVIVRHVPAIQVLTGTAYASSPSFA
jgi:hypothetical protein